ncbi:MAG TPA: DUF5709 domain-containing protein [Streptosporangiaceae bacterium]|nr:DUF5709 domain-containing protein [Streptosporangiaceae bacterium]
MTERQHESEDLEDYEVLDTSDTLTGPPGDDPLDRGVATPERWSAPIRSGGTAEEQENGESLDELLAEEEPDVGAGGDGDDEFAGLDENEPDYDVRRALAADGPDPRAGRLISHLDGDESSSWVDDGESVGFDAGIDSGGATAEEAAVHVLDEDYDSGTG